MTRTPLALDATQDALLSTAAGLSIPIVDGVPRLIVEAARSLDLDSSAT